MTKNLAYQLLEYISGLLRCRCYCCLSTQGMFFFCKILRFLRGICNQLVFCLHKKCSLLITTLGRLTTGLQLLASASQNRSLPLKDQASQYSDQNCRQPESQKVGSSKIFENFVNSQAGKLLPLAEACQPVLGLRVQDEDLRYDSPHCGACPQLSCRSCSS